MKKALSIALILLMMFSTFSFALAETTAPEAADAEIPENLVIGTTTRLSGDFFTDMWGNNTADMDIRALIHGYSTVTWRENGNYEVDASVVKEASLAQDSLGNKTYSFTLQEDLFYNDGTQITAKDYVFSTLLLAAPELTDFGSVATAMQHLVGFDGFVEGNPFVGVRLIGEYEFSLTISADYLPFFYELVLVNVTPYPMHVIAPGCDVKDDGAGATIDGPFTKELIEQTVLDENNGYRYMPMVTTGPYSLRGYDRTGSVATFEINPYYKGNFEGVKPTVQSLTVRPVEQSTMFDELASGELDLINKVTSGDRIVEGFGLQAEGKMKQVSYLRSGFSFIAFACEMEPTASLSVRKAIAMSVDAKTLTEDFLMGYGLPVYGYYGYGQWMASENQQMLVELAKYEINVNAAIGLLEGDGWTLNEDGEAYDAKAGGTRYRRGANGELEALLINWAAPVNSDMTEPLEDMIRETFKAAGIGYTLTELPFNELLKHYYRQTDRVYNMFTLGTNFDVVFDPYPTFNVDERYQGVFNTTGIRDEKLMQLADDMRKTSSDDQEGYIGKWFEFQRYWSDVLPMVPLYSNMYFDFYRSDMYSYTVNAHSSWASAILYVTFTEPEDDELVMEEGEPGDESDIAVLD